MKIIRLFGILGMFWLSTAQAELFVECVKGCEDQGLNQSVNLLLRKSESDPVVLRWVTIGNPEDKGIIFKVYAGNPMVQETIPDRGKLTFVATTNNQWEATKQFSKEELRGGTLLTVVTQRSKEADPNDFGTSEDILDWRAFRLLTTAEKERKEKGVPPGGKGSLTVVPALLQASSGHGSLPPGQGRDKQPWWSLTEMDGNTSDLDLDGEYSGIPGLTIQVSSPWETRGTDGWKEVVQKNLTGVTGHHIRFGNLEWREQPNRILTLGADKPVLELRHYYTVVTLFTNASVKTFDDKEVRGGHILSSPTYFSHETSARLKHTDDPRFWASYSRREYSADKRLLRILARHVRRDESVPGLGTVQQDDGDGGPVTYTAGFYATVRPWESMPKQEQNSVHAGLVGVDVVAARAGIGGLVTEGSAGTSTLGRAWCQVVRCGESGHALDLDKPPSGYEVAPPVASVETLSGVLPMTEEVPGIAERGPLASAPTTPDALAALPTRVRFGISANLRSGALFQTAGLLGNHVNDMKAINTYAQFVVKFTVAMVPNTQMVTTGEAIIPTQDQMKTRTSVLPNRWAWLTENPLVWIAAVTAGIGLVLAFVPGGMPLLRSIMGVITQALQIIVDGISLLLKKLAALVQWKSGD